MDNLFRTVVMAITILLIAVGSAEARTVYLKDGAVLQAQFVWREGGSVKVLVNRDVLLSFDTDEVNLKKTFARPSPRNRHRPDATRQVPRRPVMAPVSTAAREGGPAGPVTKPPVSAKRDVIGTTPGAAATPEKKDVLATAPAQQGVVPPVKAPAATSVPAPVQSAVTTQSAPPPPPVRHPLPPLPQSAPAPPPLSATTLFAILAGAFLVLVIMIVSLWKVYVKAGEAGWKSLVPIYNIVVLLKIIGRPVWWIILLFIPVINVIVQIVMGIDLARSFGKGALFGLGLTFLPIIFYPILAFGDADYRYE